MDNNKDLNAIARIEDTIVKLRNKDFTLYFFVVDSKNVPNGIMQYTYQLAKTLSDKGYKVQMVYQLPNEYSKKDLKRMKRTEKPIDYTRLFEGVGEWLGEDYMKLEHVNISTSKWEVGPADFLFIPEALSSLMRQSYEIKAPCKRIILLHNYDYVTETIPFGDEWGTYGIYDVITTSQNNKDLITDVFPYVDCKILPPYISECFRKPIKPKKLVVNIISKNTENVHKIVKKFYWKYPMYKFITFRDLRGYSKDKFAEFLQESAATVWIDTDTPFGYSALEAMRCNNIVIAKVPEQMPEWMLTEDGTITDGIVLTYNTNQIPDMLANVVGSWMQDEIPSEVYYEMEKINAKYTLDEWNTNVENLINTYVSKRIDDFEEIKEQISSKNN